MHHVVINIYINKENDIKRKRKLLVVPLGNRTNINIHTEFSRISYYVAKKKRTCPLNHNNHNNNEDTVVFELTKKVLIHSTL